ncbi:4'-phosphopantetheinyl transferase sfp [Pandoraea horticolens]|uniref:4'-phosphopantetheinyl transferase sfp n=1 Tax=Pandoraea horticolens TaxID=2508298 RepID=A0A5E4WKD5_9BURK|nr:4'-phosphopantetheinyl transferase superfamily protein [Pandoraea horticolens]VVE23516.1 4'-phosphopantetheinyl transferase sfp [Pandoraea horticolens]
MTARARKLPCNGRWPADIDVWHVSLAAIIAEQGENRDASRYLDAYEMARAGRFRYDADRYRFTVTRSVLRELLGAYTGIAPESVIFTQNQYGRPELASSLSGKGAMISFNVSHTGNDALIAISRARCVGVDVEVKQRVLNLQELAPLVCTAPERAVIEVLAPAAQRDAFLRCWTAKEAILKAIGLGIAESLLCLRVDVGNRATQRPVVVDRTRLEAAASLNFRWIDDLPECQICLAWEGRY